MLVKWKYLPVKEASWEGYWVLVKMFPSIDLETRLNLSGSFDAGSISAAATVKLFNCYREFGGCCN